MPTYQYACTDAECGHRFELVQSFTDPSASECPACGHSVRKVYGSIGVVFKGSGFYRTDSRNEPTKSSASKDSSPDSQSTGSAKKEPAAASSSSGSSGGSKSGSGSGSGSASGSGGGAKAAASA